MGKVGIILKREYKNQVLRPSFWWVTLGVPALLLIVGSVGILVPLYAAYKNLSSGRTSGDEMSHKVGVVDHSGFVDLERLNGSGATEPLGNVVEELSREFNLPKSLTEKAVALFGEVTGKAKTGENYLHFESREAAWQALEKKEIRGALVIPEDVADGGVVALLKYDHKKENRVRVSDVERALRDGILASKFPNSAARVLEPFADLNIVYLHEKKEEQEPAKKKESIPQKIYKFAIPFAFMMMLMFVIFTSNDRLLRGLMEEKQNRVVEVLLSSASAVELMTGKLVGLGLAGLTQVGIWQVLVMIPSLIFLPFLNIKVDLLLVFTIYFLLGYFIICTLSLALGSIGNNLQEANQWSMVVTLVSLSPLFFFQFIMFDSSGFLPIFFTYFPLTSPLGGIYRYAAGEMALWEFAISAAILLVSLVGAIVLAAKVFRVGILMTGKTPTPKEFWKAFRHS